ncbi:MAG: TRAP transporter small permease [Bacillota bacterium]|nr:TRAP transporter small permease [Bacillota bacterium]
MFSKIFDKIYDLILSICKVMLLFQVIIVSYVVYGRYILNNTPAWGESAVLLLMVWASLMSAALAVRDDTHIRMSIIDLVLPEKALKVLEWFNYLLVLGFAIFMIWAGYELVQLSSMSIMPGLKIKSSYLFGAVPVAGICILLMLIGRVKKTT